MSLVCLKTLLLIIFSNEFAFCSERALSGKLLSEVFTTEIYNQDELLRSRKTPLSTEVINFNHEAVALFHQKKADQFEKVLIDPLEESLSNLCKIRDEYSKAVTEMQKAAKDTTAAEKEKIVKESFLGKVFRGIVGKVAGEEAGLAVDLLSGARDTETEIKKKEKELLQTLLHTPISPENIPGINERIRLLEKAKQATIEALKYDEFAALEAYYVIKKPTFNEDTQKLIESTFVDGRKHFQNPHGYRKLLEQMLRIPTKPLDLKRTFKDDKDLLDKFYKDKIFKNYSPSTQRELAKIVLAIYHNSLSENTQSKFPVRQVCYFHGDPGCGKTTAAEQIARFFNIPFYKISIRSIADLTIANLEGTFSKDIGWFGSALIEPVPNSHTIPSLTGIGLSDKSLTKKSIKENIIYSTNYFLSLLPSMNSYKNGFLIINDFDRLLIDPKTQTAACQFCLDFLDTDKKDFRNHFFKLNLDISQLNIIITGNHEIKNDQVFDALRDRLAITKFESISDVVLDVTEDLMNECAQKYNIVLSEDLKKKMKNHFFALQKNKKLSFRQVKSHIEKTILDFHPDLRAVPVVKIVPVAEPKKPVNDGEIAWPKYMRPFGYGLTGFFMYGLSSHYLTNYLNYAYLKGKIKVFANPTLTSIQGMQLIMYPALQQELSKYCSEIPSKISSAFLGSLFPTLLVSCQKEFRSNISQHTLKTVPSTTCMLAGTDILRSYIPSKNSLVSTMMASLCTAAAVNLVITPIENHAHLPSPYGFNFSSLRTLYKGYGRKTMLLGMPVALGLSAIEKTKEYLK